jgi:flagellar basal body-associated protein FliL
LFGALATAAKSCFILILKLQVIFYFSRLFLFFSFSSSSSPFNHFIETIPKTMSAQEVQIEPISVEVKSSTASSVKSFLSGGFGGMAAVLVG